jgi:hypothetical protein
MMPRVQPHRHMFAFNRIIGLILLTVLVYGLLKVSGVLPDLMPVLPFGKSLGA